MDTIVTQVEEALDIRKVNEIIRSDYAHVFQLSELAQVNLLDLRLPYSGARAKEVPLQVQDEKRPHSFFHIYQPDIVHAMFYPGEWKKLEELLQATNYTYKVTYYGPHYWKDSRGRRTVGVELDSDYFPRSTTIYLREFGHSYGKVEINGILCDISHSGGTWDLEKGTDRDITHGWHLVGHTKSHPIIQSLIGKN